jgi:hypothetical protein
MHEFVVPRSMPIVLAMRFCSLVVVLRKSECPYSRSLALAAAAASTYGLDIDPTAKRELEVTLAARRELGPSHDDELVAGFLDRIEHELDRRVDERLARRGPAKRRGSPVHPGNIAVCIPIIAIAGGIGGLPGLITAFVALIVVFGLAELRR